MIDFWEIWVADFLWQLRDFIFELEIFVQEDIPVLINELSKFFLHL